MNGRLDMDGVIANCALSVSRNIGAQYPYDLIKDGFGYTYEDDFGYDRVREAFSTEEFWAEMPKFSWADRIVDLFERQFGDDWIFLTKGFLHPSSLSGKYKWIEKHYPQHLEKLHICLGRTKYTACDGPDSFLLDDARYNIDPWIAKGGLAYHWIEMTEVTDNIKIDARIKELEKFLQERAEV